MLVMYKFQLIESIFLCLGKKLAFTSYIFQHSCFCILYIYILYVVWVLYKTFIYILDGLNLVIRSYGH